MTEHGRNYNTDLFRCDQAISHLMHPDQIERAIDHRLEEAASTFRRSGDEFIFNDAAIREIFRAGEGLHARLPEVGELKSAEATINRLSEDWKLASEAADRLTTRVERLQRDLRKGQEFVAKLNERIDELERELADASE